MLLSRGLKVYILAADSRVILQAGQTGQPPYLVNFDNASKLLNFSEPHNYVGAVTYGLAVIGGRTAYSYIPEIEEEILSDQKRRLTIEQYSERLSKFFMDRWAKLMPRDYQGPDMTFIVGGYDQKEAYGRVFLFEIPRHPKAVPRNADDFGMTWGGQLQVACRIIHGFDPNLINIVRNKLNLTKEQEEMLFEELKKNLEFPIPYQVLPLQDCVNLAIYLIRSTISAQDLSVGIRGVGGLIEVAAITRTAPLKYVQKKEIKGEYDIY